MLAATQISFIIHKTEKSHTQKVSWQDLFIFCIYGERTLRTVGSLTVSSTSFFILDRAKPQKVVELDFDVFIFF